MRDQSGGHGQADGAAREPRPPQPAAAVARPERWARLRRALWQPPRPHGEQPRERVVGPLELFYDLAVVVLVSQAAHRLAGHLSWGGFGQFAAVFTLVWIAWVNGSLHHELHGHEDARARSTFLLQILLLAAMGAFIPQAGGARGAAFAVAAAVLFAVLTVLWLLAARGDRPEYRRPSRLFVTGTAACAVLLAGTALLPAGARVPAWGLLDAAYLAGFAAVIARAGPAPGALVITDALTERFGAFIIIVLGETLTGVVAGLSGQPVSGLTLAVGLVAVVVGFGAWWTYFDFAGHRQPRQEPAASLQWILGHLPLTAAIAAMGAAMLSLVDHAHDGRTPAATAWILGAGTAIVLCATMLVSASLDAWRSDRRLYRPLARTCAAVAVACLALGALRPAPLALGLLLVFLLAIPWVLAVARRVADAADLPGSPSAAMGGKLELQVVSEGAWPDARRAGRMQPMPEDWKRAVAVVAHPDDLEYGVASAVARWTGQGKEVAYLLATQGEAGIAGLPPEEAGPLRAEEERRSAAIVGVREVGFLGHRDGVMEYGVPLRRDLAAAFRRLNPEVVITMSFDLTWGENGPVNHSDHRAVGLAVLDACRDAANGWMFPEAGPPHAGIRDAYVASGDPTHFVDVTATIDAGIASLREHRAYLEGLGGDFDPDEFLRNMAGFVGLGAGCEYAVGFRRYPMG